MRSPTARNIVAERLLVLRNADPRAYEALSQAFQVWASEVTVAVTEANQNEILNFQGRAQLALSIAETIRDPNAWLAKTEKSNG